MKLRTALLALVVYSLSLSASAQTLKYAFQDDFNGGTDDIRESPAIAITQSLINEGCEIVAYDPAAMDRAKSVLRGVKFAKSAQAAAKNADALLILTDWKEFTELNLDQLELRYPVIIDGRNLYDPAKMASLGFTYYSVGRPVVYGRQIRKLAVAK